MSSHVLSVYIFDLLADGFALLRGGTASAAPDDADSHGDEDHGSHANERPQNVLHEDVFIFSACIAICPIRCWRSCVAIVNEPAGKSNFLGVHVVDDHVGSEEGVTAQPELETAGVVQESENALLPAGFIYQVV